jgi:hypothetical protein
VKRSGFVDYSNVAIELLELTAQSGEMTRHGRGIADIIARTKVPIEGCFDDRRFCGTGILGRLSQACGRAFGEVNANSGFHEGLS